MKLALIFVNAEKTRTMSTITPLEKMTIPVGGQVIELQQLDYEAGGMSLLRTRIREKSRFTVFDIDPQSARQWGEALLRWANSQPQSQPDAALAAQEPQ
jgi:hypothetical protein